MHVNLSRKQHQLSDVQPTRLIRKENKKALILTVIGSRLSAVTLSVCPCKGTKQVPDVMQRMQLRRSAWDKITLS